MIELTFVIKKKITKKDLKAFMKGRKTLDVQAVVSWDEEALTQDTGNFNGVVMGIGDGEMVFIENDHPEIDRLLESDDLPYAHVYFPEIGS